MQNNSAMSFFTIKDLENLSGIKAHTIRMWEQRYNFLKPQRTRSNIRYYDGEELKKLLNVALLNKHGYRISRINRMSEEEIRENVLAITEPMAGEERLVFELIRAMTETDVAHFERVLDDYILTKGLHKAWQFVILPFLEKTRLLWITNHVQPVQEHLVVNILRQKILVALDRAYSRMERDLTFLLFLPEGEFHELHLLYVYYLLRTKGITAFYLGMNVPVAEAAAIRKERRLDYVYTHLTAIAGNFQGKRFVSQLHRYFDPVSVIISGPLAARMAGNILPENIICKPAFADAVRFLHAC